MKNQDWNTKSDPLFEKFNKVTTGQLSSIESRYASTDFIRFDPEKIHKLAEPFINAQQMIDYVGNNDKLINAAGRLIQYQKVERPKWFEEIIKNKSESKEECLQILNDNCKTSKEIYDKGYTRILNRLWSFYSPTELRKLTPNIKWSTTKWDDELIYSILSQYKDTREIRKSKIHKHLLFKMQVDKGEKFPKSYALYQSMTIPQSQIARPKRGKYKKGA